MLPVIKKAYEEAAKRRIATTSKRIVSHNEPRGITRKRNTGQSAGMAQLTEMMRLLDCFGMSRSRVQKQLHSGMAGSGECQLCGMRYLVGF